MSDLQILNDMAEAINDLRNKLTSAFDEVEYLRKKIIELKQDNQFAAQSVQADACRKVNHFYVEGVCAHCGYVQPKIKIDDDPCANCTHGKKWHDEQGCHDACHCKKFVPLEML